MKKVELIHETAIAVLDSKELQASYPGFQDIIGSLVKEGTVMLPCYTEDMKKHLASFGFIKYDGLVPNAIDLIQYSFEVQAYLKSDEFFRYANAKKKELDETTRRLEDEVIRSRMESFDLNVLIGTAANAVIKNNQVVL